MADAHSGKSSGDVAFPWYASAAAHSDCKMCVGTYKSSFDRFLRTYNLALRGLLASFRVLAARGSACATIELPRRICDVGFSGKSNHRPGP